MQTQTIHLTNLVVDECNPRRSIEGDEEITQLASNIQSMGIVAPLVVRPALPAGVEPLNPENIKYRVLCGSRRMAAARQAGLTSVPCIVRDLTDAEASAVALTEQDSHKTLHFLERADGFLKWRDGGATVDEIAERVGMKRAAAYSILGMAEKLTPESRDACFSKRLNETIARKLATVPRSAQDACLAKLLEPNYEGKPKTTREAEDVVDSFRRDLAKAPFDMADPVLSCSEFDGPCTECPLRSGTQPELFPDVQNPNLCTSPAGYESRADAMWQRLVADGDAHRGPRCLDEKQSEKYFNGVGALRDDAPYVEASAIAYEDTAQRPYNALLGAGYRMQVVLARVPKKLDVVELLGKEGLQAKLDEVGKIRCAQMPAVRVDDDGEKLSTEERKKHREKVERRQRSIRKGIAALVEKVGKRGIDKKLIRIMCESLFRQGAMRHTIKRRDVQEHGQKYLGRLDEAGLTGFLFESVCEYELYGDEGGVSYPEFLKEAMAFAGLDPKDYEREVVAEEKAAPVKKEAKGKKGKAA